MSDIDLITARLLSKIVVRQIGPTTLQVSRAGDEVKTHSFNSPAWTTRKLNRFRQLSWIHVVESTMTGTMTSKPVLTRSKPLLTSNRA